MIIALMIKAIILPLLSRRLITKEYHQRDQKEKFVFSPQEIELRDDAFHITGLLPFTEWWYFDAKFENGYTVQLGIRVISFLKRFIVFSRLDIYKDGNLLSHKRKTYIMNDFQISSEEPNIKLAEKEIIKGYVDKDTGKWIYNLSFELYETSAVLQFTGLTKGWTGKVPGSNWVVALPRAEVRGKIRVNGKEIDVKGIGYHDHNWDVKPSAVIFNYGWTWGKINSKNYTMTWANIMETRSRSNLILVINKKNNGHVNINPKYLKIVTKDSSMQKEEKIQNGFTIEVNNDNLSIYVDMKVLDIHHVRIMGFMKYWRYHVRCTGSITFENKKETIDEIQMAEFLKFK